MEIQKIRDWGKWKADNTYRNKAHFFRANEETSVCLGSNVSGKVYPYHSKCLLCEGILETEALATIKKWAFDRDDDKPNHSWMNSDQNDGHGYAVSEIRNVLRSFSMGD